MLAWKVKGKNFIKSDGLVWFGLVWFGLVWLITEALQFFAGGWYFRYRLMI